VIEAVLRPDLWLADLLERPCYAADPLRLSKPCDLPPAPAFIYTKVPASDGATMRRLRGLGFSEICTNVTFRGRPASMPAGQVSVRLADAGDEAAVCSIARRSFLFDRFHRDPAIGAAADRIKEAWAGAFFTGARGEWMIVAEIAGAAVGFAQILKTGQNAITIDLIAVDATFRGRGAARAMIALAQRPAGGAPVITVGTQQENLPSMQLYSALGLEAVDRTVALHLHLPRVS
jgi:ribosomal protein S18 acetylase RimI-like enzyme